MTGTSTTAVTPLARDSAANSGAQAFERYAWRKNLEREHAFEALSVEGSLPEDLRGTLYRNGPALFSFQGQRVSHPFEGDGAITAIQLDGKAARGACRVISSSGLQAERAAGRVLFGSKATLPRRLLNAAAFRNKNVANTSVMQWQGRLFALMEAGRPTEFDPCDLRTIGETNLDRVVVSMFSAHPHRVEAHRTLYGFGLKYELGRTRVHLYALPDDRPARRLGNFVVPGWTLLHDFIATENHLVFFVSPVRLRPLQGLLQVGGFANMIQWCSELGTEVICVPLARPNEPLRFTVDSFFQWHFANAFEQAGSLFVDYVKLPQLMGILKPAASTAPAVGSPNRLHRAQIDLQRGRMTSEERLQVPVEFPSVAPSVAGKPHRYTWLSSPDLERVLRLDMRSGTTVQYQLPAHQAGIEPLFVPRRDSRGEEAGYVLLMCTDAQQERAFLAVFDAGDLASGPRAKIWFDHYIPTTIHGTWVNGA
jgi:all-trans-8'-apo-beta-carotenal 15,15'-oxygenase